MLIGHLSDLHVRRHLPGTSNLSARRSREAPDLLERALRAMRRLGVDVVAVTGDLVDIPGYQLGGAGADDLHAALTADYELCHDILTDAGLPFIVVPGNHDDQAVMGSVFDSGTGHLDVDGVRFVSFWDGEDERHVPQRTGAERELFDRTCVDDALQVHLQHYVIHQVPSTDWPYTYADGDRLRAEMTATGRIRLSLSGHYHPGLDVTRVDDTFFSVVPALAEHPHRYRVHDVTESGVTSLEHSVVD